MISYTTDRPFSSGQLYRNQRLQPMKSYLICSGCGAKSPVVESTSGGGSYRQLVTHVRHQAKLNGWGIPVGILSDFLCGSCLTTQGRSEESSDPQDSMPMGVG